MLLRLLLGWLLASRAPCRLLALLLALPPRSPEGKCGRTAGAEGGSGH
jgi:hypothetical protein